LGVRLLDIDNSINIRQQTEQIEVNTLSPFAALAINSKGRSVHEEQCTLRTAYQRDRDRILHCKSFRRLKHKTQVFLAPEGDHYRTRLTHTLEVSQIARTIARALRLNEDLTEAIALGHDLGHTPFGHAGEHILNKLSSSGFKHYLQSVRVVEKLERGGKGLNLTWEVRDGIEHHTTGELPSTLEGQVVRLSDRIAYINHDIDDAIRAGVLSEAEIPISVQETLGKTPSKRINALILDTVFNSLNKKQIVMSYEINNSFDLIHKFMFDKVYTNPAAKSEEFKVQYIIRHLYEYFMDNIQKLPSDYFNNVEHCGAETAVIDYIAGMTDHYAIQLYNEIFIPGSWKKC
jgi:dGTPase